MKRIVLSLTIIAALFGAKLHAKEKLQLLASIKPIHALVSAVGGELANVQQIIPNFASPHHYSLRPSDIRKLNKADLVFRIDPQFERFLEKSLRNIRSDKIIVLSKTPALKLLEANAAHGHGDAEHHDDHGESGHEALDFHLWLNPSNAIVMATKIRDSLSTISPDNAEAFQANTEQLIEQIREQDQQIQTQLKKVNESPFLVMHDAWQYFTEHYGLNQLGTISAQERLSPSAKAISEARTTLKRTNAQCLVTEINLKQRVLRTLVEGLAVKIVEIDPLGREIPNTPQAYPQLLQYTADKLGSCLKQK